MQHYMSSQDFDGLDARNEQAVEKAEKFGGSPDDFGYLEKSKCNVFEEDDTPTKKWYKFW